MFGSFLGECLAERKAGNSISRNFSQLSTTFFLEDRAPNSKIFLEDNTITSSFHKAAKSLNTLTQNFFLPI